MLLRGEYRSACRFAREAIGEQLMAVRRMEDGEEKRRAVLKLVRGLVRLRKSDRECERGQREAAQAARPAEIHDVWAEGARRRQQRTEDPPPPRLPPSPSLWRTGRRAGAEQEYEHEDETDVRGRMAEVIEQMSDAEIAETLRRSGYLRGRAEDGGGGAEGGANAERSTCNVQR